MFNNMIFNFIQLCAIFSSGQQLQLHLFRFPLFCRLHIRYVSICFGRGLTAWLVKYLKDNKYLFRITHNPKNVDPNFGSHVPSP